MKYVWRLQAEPGFFSQCEIWAFCAQAVEPANRNPHLQQNLFYMYMFSFMWLLCFKV